MTYISNNDMGFASLLFADGILFGEGNDVLGLPPQSLIYGWGQSKELYLKCATKELIAMAEKSKIQFSCLAVPVAMSTIAKSAVPDNISICSVGIQWSADDIKISLSGSSLGEGGRTIYLPLVYRGDIEFDVINALQSAGYDVSMIITLVDASSAGNAVKSKVIPNLSSKYQINELIRRYFVCNQIDERRYKEAISAYIGIED